MYHTGVSSRLRITFWGPLWYLAIDSMHQLTLSDLGRLNCIKLTRMAAHSKKSIRWAWLYFPRTFASVLSVWSRSTNFIIFSVDTIERVGLFTFGITFISWKEAVSSVWSYVWVLYLISTDLHRWFHPQFTFPQGAPCGLPCSITRNCRPHTYFEVICECSVAK